MISIHNYAAALQLTPHLVHAVTGGLMAMTHILVVESHDTDKAIERELGFSPLVCPIEGHRWSDPRFVPHWSWLDHTTGWYELTITVGDGGYAFILLVPDHELCQSELGKMCSRFYEK